MSENHITLKPVYSCPASEQPENVGLPEGWQLSWHQVETLKAIRNPDLDVVFNTAMTGDGKSLAAYLESLQVYFCAIGLYPTNELARDQEFQIRDYIAKFQPYSKPRVVRLSGETLEIYAENEKIRKSAAIATRSGQSEILLTNPDIFHYLHRGAYITKNDIPDKLWGRIDKDLDLFIFDEFHVFSAPQIASVLNTLLLMRHTNRRKKFLFLSATPNPELLDGLKKAGFRVKSIHPVEENKYRFPENLEEAQQLKTQGWRQVSRKIFLDFISLEPTANASETWLRNNSDRILAYFQQYPGSKGAIILNSIASVKRLTPLFRELFALHRLTVGENTGLSGKEEKGRSLDADLVLGTSTIDVGVDFKINFLIFESADAGNFIQRLGRLGRHDGYEYDGNRVDFNRFTACALVPNFLVERLFLGDTPVLEAGGKYDRVFFHDCVREKYRQINDFRGYYRKWGGVQSAQLYWQLGHKTIQQQYRVDRQAFRDDCQRVFQINLGKVAKEIRQWGEEWRQLSGKKAGNPIAEDAVSFRGSSPLQCGLWDLSEPEGGDRFKTYDLPGILSNLDIEPMAKVTFLRILNDTASRTKTPIAKGRFEYCLGFLKLQGYREERLNWRFIYPGNLREIAHRWQVQVLGGIEVWQPENPWIREVNKRLKRQVLVSYVLPYPVAEMRSRLRLPMHFAIYPISDENSIHAAAPYSIAFGQSALLIDTLASWLKSTGEEIWIVSV